MATRFREVRELQGEQVRIRFDDGREIVALLLCATKDVDGSKHLIYSTLESVASAEVSAAGAAGCCYADAKTLVRIETADAKNIARGLRGWDWVGLEQQVEETSPETWRRCA